MANFYESKPMQWVKKAGEKVVGNKGIQAISSGMMMVMGVILLGAVFQLLAVILQTIGIIDQSSGIYSALMVPYKVSMGFISLYVAFTIAYSYAKSLKMQALMAGLNSILIFLIAAAPIKTVDLAGEAGGTFTGMDTMALDAKGMFVAIIVALTCVALTQTALPVLITGLLGMPLAALTSVPGIIIIVIIASLLWTMGVHGTVAVYAAIAAPLMQYYATNYANHEAGQALVFMPIALFGIINCCGGTGNTLALCVMGLFSKSEQLKAVSKAAIVPGLFNINEPVIFGYPIMYNPIMCIPFILNPVITMIICYFGYMIGFFKPAYISITATLPVGFAQYLTTLSWTNIFIPVIAFAVAFACYWPFFKVYEKELVAKEAQAKEEK